MKRIIATFILPCLLLFGLGACRHDRHYTNELRAEELARDVQNALSDTAFLSADVDYLADYFQMPDGMSDYKICFASDGNNLNEFGIWHTANGTPKEIKLLMEGYLKDSLERNQSFYDSYIPGETPKLRDAEVRVYGNYVAYAILNDADRKIFFNTVEQDLLAEQ